ncbi:YhzD family protein [Metabacillus herbersteinensis]|uniref:YhzD family protein n=1 Tax=Metabacillus herbersteinensis TaxID=283816 RepID=A0ABV6GFA1_9BACI
MGNYYLTVFDKSGEKLLDESFEAATEAEAKAIGEQRLEEKDFSKKTHRCTSSTGKLILFAR